MRVKAAIAAVGCCAVLGVSGVALAAPPPAGAPVGFVTIAAATVVPTSLVAAVPPVGPLGRMMTAPTPVGSPTTILAAYEGELPPSDLFKPILPDLSGDTVPGRAVKAGRLVLGAVGFGILGYGLYRFFLLAAEALTGKRGIKSIVEQLIVYLVAFSVLFMLLGGSMYQFLKAIFEFAHTSV